MDNKTLDRLWAAHVARIQQERVCMASIHRRARDMERQFAAAGLPFVFDFTRVHR